MPDLRPLFFAAILAALALPACVAPKPPPPPKATPKPTPRPESYWRGDGVTGAPRVRISLSRQRADFFKGDKLVSEVNISTGKKNFETPSGSFKITQKNKDHVSNLYGNFVDPEGTVVKKDVDMSKEKLPEGLIYEGAKMPFYMRFTAGFGMHAGRVPNYRASHGCVRMPRAMAEHFFNNVEVGTPVLVEP